MHDETGIRGQIHVVAGKLGVVSVGCRWMDGWDGWMELELSILCETGHQTVEGSKAFARWLMRWKRAG